MYISKRYALSQLDLSNNKTDKDDLWVGRKPMLSSSLFNVTGVIDFDQYS